MSEPIEPNEQDETPIEAPRNARDRSEQSPGRAGTGSRDRKVAQRLADTDRARDPEARAAKREKSLAELLAEAPRVPANVSLRQQLDEQIGDARIDDGNRSASEARDGEGNIPFIGWFDEPSGEE